MIGVAVPSLCVAFRIFRISVAHRGVDDQGRIAHAW